MTEQAATGPYAQADVVHETDFLTPLHHGVIRYVPGPNVKPEIRCNLPVKNDRKYVYIPAGYVNREERFLEQILGAIGLEIPNLIIVTAATEGTAEEQISNKYVVQNAESHPLAKDWTEAHQKEVLVAKVRELLKSTMESCVESGAWLMPQHPRRRNGAAQMICQALPKVGSPVAVGVIGLEEEDELEGFTASIKTNMEPLGSPIRTVSAIDYDPNVKDRAPCPQLTHLLIFESPHEMLRFREKLLALVPDLLLAFGDLTPSAMENVYSFALDGSPIVLLKHTGDDVDNLCRMFRHVKKEIEAGQVGTTDDPAATKPATVAKKTRLAPMPDMDDAQIQLFVSTWPSDFDSQTVVLADPLLLTGGIFQKRVLRAITAAFDLRHGSDDMRRVKKGVLDYAWSFYDIAERHAKQKKKAAETLHIQLVACTLFSIVASVLYDQVYGAGGHPKRNPFQLTIFVLTIVLPLYITSLKKETESSNPTVRWAAFEVAASRIESEIFKFRTQVGVYRATQKNQQAMRKPLATFATKTRDIWMTIRQYLADDGMKIPTDFWDQGSPLEGRIKAPISEPEEASEPVDSRSGFNLSRTIRSLPRKMFPKREEESDIEAPATETTPILASHFKSSGMEQRNGISKGENDDDESIEETSVDDHYSSMTAEEYMEVRMKQKLIIKSQELELMVSRTGKISNLIKAVTIFSGATAALSLQWSVPIILAVTAALGSGQEFRKYKHRIEVGNTMIVQLNELKLWWTSLSVYQKQLPHNKDRLVLQSERIITTELSSAYDAAQARSED